MSRFKELCGYAVAGLGHLCGVGIVATALATALMSPGFAFAVLSTTIGDDQLLAMSTTSLALHVAFAAAIWAFLFIVFQYARVRRRELRGKTQRIIRLSRGNVMTETLVILPLFFLLTFGMAQMVINNIAGTLANVAAFEAGRAAWIWKPEADAGRMGVTQDQAKDRARVAAAMVMTPIAPGEYFGNAFISSAEARNMRHVLTMTHLPILGGFIPSEVTDLLSLSTFAEPIAAEGNRNFVETLDTSSFAMRTVKKFTHAYHATDVEIKEVDGRLGVQIEYWHHIAMPMVGRVFGSEGLEMKGLRFGRYTKFRRFYGFRTQINTPNGALPADGYLGGAGPSEPSINSGIRNETGYNR